MPSHSDVLALWPSQSELSADLRGEGVEIGVSGVGMWSVRDDIPSRYWPALIKIAAQRDLRFPGGEEITLELLAGSQRALREAAQ